MNKKSHGRAAIWAALGQALLTLVLTTVLHGGALAQPVTDAPTAARPVVAQSAAPANVSPRPAAAAVAPSTSTTPAFSEGNVAWVLIATVLVLMMAFPGLALFYGGLSRDKNSVNGFMQILAAMALGSLAFLFFGFGLAFLPGNGFIGTLTLPSAWFWSDQPAGPLWPTIPIGLFAIFQLAFAAVTVAILLGAWVERVRFQFVVVFVPLWIVVVYSPVAHWVWAEHGWLHDLGVIDFAGGTVVHVCSGFAGLAAAVLLGKRHGFGTASFEPNSTALVALGAAFLIVGWYGFNAGSALAADASAIRALITTHAATCAGVATWLVIELVIRKFTTLIGVLTGALGALVAITPASGYVTPDSAALIGALGAAAAYFGAVVIRSRRWFDDSLDVFGIHGMAGIAGSLATGVLASSKLAPTATFGAQLTATLAVAFYSFVATAVLIVLLRLLVRARVTTHEEKSGLDATYHGEPA